MSDRLQIIRCPMCNQKFVNSNELNRYKRTCPAKDNE